MKLLLAILLTGCSGHKPVRIISHMNLERQCLKSIALTDHTRCSGKSMNDMVCTGMEITYRVGCETLDAR